MKTKEEIIYLLQVGLGFLFLGIISSYYFLAIVALILFTLPFKFLRKSVIKFWKTLGEVLGKIFSPIVIGLVFFLILTPLAFFSKILGSDELCMKKPLKTNWHDLKIKIDQDFFDKPR